MGRYHPAVHKLLPILLLVACSAPAAPDVEPGPAPEAAAPTREPLIHIDVPAKVAAGGGRFKADWSFDLIASEEWSAHVHVIPEGQLVPPHRHPGNDELVFVAAGEGEWASWTADGPDASVLGSMEAMLAPAGVVHSIRNRRPAPLATVVVQRPEFGQNWFVLPDEVEGSEKARRFDRAAEAGHAFDGWELTWVTDIDDAGADRDVLYLVGEGEGTLSFEDTSLPLRPGTFVRAPPGLPHRLTGVTALAIRIPRETSAP